MSRPDEGLVELIRRAGSATTILEQHAEDTSGRCRICRAGGDSSGRVMWPCSLHLAAAEALRRGGEGG